MKTYSAAIALCYTFLLTTHVLADPPADCAILSLPTGTRWPTYPGLTTPFVPQSRSDVITLSGDGRLAFLVVQRGASPETYSWSASDGFHRLPLPEGTTAAWILASSYDGHVVCGAYTELSSGLLFPTPAIWTDGQLTTPVVTGNPPYACASAITSDGTTVFGSRWEGLHRVTFRWSAIGGAVDIPLDRDPGLVNGCSSDGGVIAFQEPFLWTAAIGLVSLPAAPIALSRDGAFALPGNGPLLTSTDGWMTHQSLPDISGISPASLSAHAEVIAFSASLGDQPYSAAALRQGDTGTQSLWNLAYSQGVRTQLRSPLGGAWFMPVAVSDDGQVLAGPQVEPDTFWIVRIPQIGSSGHGACCFGVTCTALLTSHDCESNQGRFIGSGTVCSVGAGNPVACCTANLDGVGGVGVGDIFSFLERYFDPTRSSWSSSTINFYKNPMDYNGISLQDLFEFLATYFRGCPN